jgi:hypothetical protein
METNIEDIQMYVNEIYAEHGKKTIRLNSREEDFITGMKNKIDKYGASPKQRKWICDIYEKYLGDAEEQDTDATDRFSELNKPRTWKDG